MESNKIYLVPDVNKTMFVTRFFGPHLDLSSLFLSADGLSCFSLPIYHFIFSCHCTRSVFLFFSFPFFFNNMCILGERSFPIHTGDVDQLSVVEVSSGSHLPSTSPVVINDVQQQIKGKDTIFHSLREELRRGQLTGPSLSQSSPKVCSSCMPAEGTRITDESRLPENSISLFAWELTFHGRSVQGACSNLFSEHLS